MATKCNTSNHFNFNQHLSVCQSVARLHLWSYLMLDTNTNLVSCFWFLPSHLIICLIVPNPIFICIHSTLETIYNIFMLPLYECPRRALQNKNNKYTLICTWKQMDRRWRSFSTGVIQSLYPALKIAQLLHFRQVEVSRPFSKAASCKAHGNNIYPECVDHCGQIMYFKEWL